MLAQKTLLHKVAKNLNSIIDNDNTSDWPTIVNVADRKHLYKCTLSIRVHFYSFVPPQKSNRATHRLHLSWVVPHVDVGVLQGLVHRDAFGGVDDEHLGQEVSGLARCRRTQQTHTVRLRAATFSTSSKSGFLKKGMSIYKWCSNLDPQNDMYSAADPHLKMFCTRHPPEAVKEYIQHKIQRFVTLHIAYKIMLHIKLPVYIPKLNLT